MRRALPLTLAAAALSVLALLAPAALAHRHRSLQPARTPGQSTAAFGLSLLRRLPPGNLVFSPDSIAAALAMAGSGAGGKTAEQIAEVLHLSSPGAFDAIGKLQTTIAAEQAAAGRGDPEPPTLDIADGLFLQEGFPVQPSFLSGLSEDFGSTPQTVNFERDPEAAVRQINEWVASHTGGLIPKVINEVQEDARLILANAIYLNADWTQEFKARDVATGTFHSSGESSQVPFMHATESLPYTTGPGFQAVELPYRSSTLSLMVLLPRSIGVSSLEHSLTATALGAIANRMRSSATEISLPKFHIVAQTELTSPLEELGITAAFRPGNADFKPINPTAALNISRVVHAADIRVQEKGTVAAAATIVEIEATAKELAPPHPVAFDADRPFLFFLRDQRTGAVLFARRLLDAGGAQA